MRGGQTARKGVRRCPATRVTGSDRAHPGVTSKMKEKDRGKYKGSAAKKRKGFGADLIPPWAPPLHTRSGVSSGS